MANRLRDSSLTRVQPAFEGLYALDETGATWSKQLLGLGSRSGRVLDVDLELGALRGAPLFEHRIVAPRSYLEWLLKNGSQYAGQEKGTL